MKGSFIFSSVLALLSCVKGSPDVPHDPRDVTFWNLEKKTLGFNPTNPRPMVVSEYTKTASCSAHGMDSTIVEWGLTIPDGVDSVTCDEGDQCFDYGIAKVVITYNGNCQRITWSTGDLTELKDCVNLLGHWYGGGAQYADPWPMETNPRDEQPFVTTDTLGISSRFGGISERYWVSSIGLAAKVEDDVPLFLSLPDNNGDGTADQMCYSSRYEAPFVASPTDPTLYLTYYICSSDDVRQVYDSTFKTFYAFPNDIPDERMITNPIWSTWAEYHSDIDDAKVINYAQLITDHGFANSQVEIDDNWETCYGEQVFDLAKFPDPPGMIDELHTMGYRVTLWITPFINQNCPSFATADNGGFFVKDANGVTQLTSWWDGGSAGIIDFTNPDAALWWTTRLQNLKLENGIDSFKFDAGEASWLPDVYTLNLPTNYWPNGYTTAYSNAVAQFGKMIEVRVGYSTQQNPIFSRMLDKDSRWGYDNGLTTMIPTLMHHSLIGYPFILPDMVGGNAYSGQPSAELFVRWAQANTFMPSIQFSLLPWEFGADSDMVTNATLQVMAIHAAYSPVIIELARNSTNGQGPIIRPTWWLCPQNEDCLLANQQFLLGDDILVAPIVIEAATSVDVVFPPGSWAYQGVGPIYDGPSKQTIAGLNIDSNVYFTRV